MKQKAASNDDATRLDPFFGLISPQRGWVPSVRYLLRRQRIMNILRRLESGSLIEIGCGAGGLLAELSALGYRCQGVEESSDALSLSKSVMTELGLEVPISGSITSDWQGAFDTVCAFDVLEHIKDDRSALTEWSALLRPRGKIVLSVPAHSSRWGPGDEWAGHFRRYNRVDLERLLDDCHLTIVHLECYGFPVANFTEWTGRRIYKRLLEAEGRRLDKSEATARSGVQRDPYSRIFLVMNSLFGRLALRLAYRCQSLFSRTDWGSGYLIVASRR